MFKLCPNCGAHNAPTANFCTKCGANLAGVAATQPQAPATPDTTNGEADTVSATSQSPVATAPTADAKSGAAPETTKPISTLPTILLPMLQPVRPLSQRHSLIQPLRLPSSMRAVTGGI